MSTAATETDKNHDIWSVLSETEQYFNKCTPIYHNRHQINQRGLMVSVCQMIKWHTFNF